MTQSITSESRSTAPMGSAAFTGVYDQAAAAHLLRRAGFGASREHLARALELGLDKTLAEVFAQREHDDSMRVGMERLLALEKVEPVQAHWMALLIANRAPLVERVALMWHNHFATSFDKVLDSRLMFGQIELFRAQGLGDFRVLLHSVARDPAMLLWLDGDQNRSGQPNENFAREVMELFGLGIGNYTEQDVSEAARAFTGWGVDKRQAKFRGQYHDGGEKRIFGQRANFAGEEAIDLVLSQPACSRHIARRLLSEFVVPDPDAADVEAWAEVLRDEDWNVARTLRRLLASQGFFSAKARRARIAGPVELLTSVCIALGARPAPSQLARAAASMGQALLRPPSVKGWDGGRTWIHAGSWLARHEFLSGLMRGEISGSPPDLASAFGNPGRDKLVESALSLLLPDGVPIPFRETIEAASRDALDDEDAARRVATLILTAPEAHLI